MKNYESPIAQIVAFSATDIILSSLDGPPIDDNVNMGDTQNTNLYTPV